MVSHKEKVIMHYDMDCFFAAIEMRDDPSLVGKPMIVGQSIVTTANYEARKYGIHSAMPVTEAKKLCPRVIIVPVHHEKYLRESDIIHELALKVTYKIEFIASDEGYIDISDIIGKYISKEYFADKFRKRIYDITKLNCSVGIGFNKLSAKIASNVNKPNGQFIFYNYDDFIAYVRNKDISIIPGVGKKFQEELHNNNIYKIQDVYDISLNDLCYKYGKNRGEFLYAYVRGIDHSPVEYDRPTHSIGNETTFRINLTAEDEISNEISDLFEYSYNRMIENGFICKTVSIKIKYATFRSITRSKTFERPTDLKTQLKLAVDELIEKAEIKEPVRLLGVYFGNLTKKSVRQLTL